jgi:hypothetical protein
MNDDKLLPGFKGMLSDKEKKAKLFSVRTKKYSLIFSICVCVVACISDCIYPAMKVKRQTFDQVFDSLSTLY